ncbi:beta-phosphoglucomutase family hydrolase [Raineyella fluvialis]|uniref:Beta-phosphoglucomutase n=1 Tax=Raineyella fluvialis TaxID=2662261 RepID=A0A5Q2FGZ8_9ACTN|nr:beta-phosphoglucomutase family hydrolase [Raineyella fluvialis]QGF23975.1 beta-phosphoglucomutase family hydrolase [Raineyella fluvialis]
MGTVTALDWGSVDAALFDLDGVVTPTDEIHRRAWAEMFRDVLAEAGAPAWSDEDYFDHVDGRQRLDGVRAVLEARGLTLPEGSPDDPPRARTIHGLGARKNEAFLEVLHRQGIAGYPGSVRLLDHLAAKGIATAVVSSSRNARLVLDTAGLTGRFDAVIDGLVAAEHDLPGKPAPDTYCYAARLLGVACDRAVVLEDAVSGVAAGRAGGFAAVVGVDRGVGADALLAAGADLVVTDLADLVPCP